MNLAPMSYKDYVWPCNPENIRVEQARSVAEFSAPQGAGTVQDNGAAPRRVSGSGRFFGNRAREEFARLSAVFASGGSGALRLPGEAPFEAAFASLTEKGLPRPSEIGYEFAFLEDQSAVRPAGETSGIHICSQSETLWDIANRYGLDVDALLAANPQVEWPNDLKEGEEVTVA